MPLDFFSTETIMATIPIGKNGYALSYIEAIGTLFGLLCIWLASKEKTINYLFGLLNVSLFAIIFFQIQLYASLLLQIFFFVANIYGWYAWSRQTNDQQLELKIRWLSKKQTITWLVICIVGITLLTFYIDDFFGYLTSITVKSLQYMGVAITMPVLEKDAFPFWDATMTVLSIAAMILMTRKYIENWLLWIIINLISVVIYAQQNVYAMSIEYVILLIIAINGVYTWTKSASASHNYPFFKRNK